MEGKLRTSFLKKRSFLISSDFGLPDCGQSSAGKAWMPAFAGMTGLGRRGQFADGSAQAGHKSFLVLSFKKELLSFEESRR
jgi:hypothetical protein